MNIMNSFYGIFERIAAEASRLAHYDHESWNTNCSTTVVCSSFLMGTDGQFPRTNSEILKLSVHLHIVQKSRCVSFYIHSPKYVYDVVIDWIQIKYYIFFLTSSTLESSSTNSIH
jgi:hypothetical protein